MSSWQPEDSFVTEHAGQYYAFCNYCGYRGDQFGDSPHAEAEVLDHNQRIHGAA